MVALDARVVLHPPSVTEAGVPQLAICPYPEPYVTPWKLCDGTSVTIRPIRPEDEPLLVKFHETLSDRSVYYRYFGPLRLEERGAHERFRRICFVDYDRVMALVVEHRNPPTGSPEILGVGRLSKQHHANEAEFALTISDRWQRHGLGAQLLKLLVQMGRDEKLDRITATILPDNHAMLALARRAGFAFRRATGETDWTVEISCHE